MSGSLNSITSNASTGLAAVQAQIAALSDNIANAGVAGYSEKRLNLSAFNVGGQTEGVQQGPISRSIDASLQASIWSSASKVGALTVRSQVLTAVNDTQGTPGDGTSLSDSLTALQSSFTLLQSQPSSQTQQSAVVAAADTLANSINGTASAITAQRNGVQNQIVSSVNALNDALAAVQSTTNEIITATTAGQSTATLEDQRDSALQTISGLLDVHYSKQADGAISILGQNGLSIPLSSRFSTQSATLAPADAYAPGADTVPPILLQSSVAASAPVDVTTQLSGGTLGELIHLRDTTLPADTASLDAFSAKLANNLSSQGLQLYTDGSTTQPLTAYTGLSSAIQVNQAVTAAPSLVRDGTPGSTYPVNSASGPASYSDLIDRVVGTSFAASGTRTSLSADAQSFVSQQSAATSRAGSDLTSATAYQTTLSTKFSDGSGVNVDRELGLMVSLQNSYQANARVLQTTQTLFNALVTATAPV